MVPISSFDDHAALVAALAAQLPADKVIQTHISSVLLSGDLAFKLKKPAHFSFLDFRPLAARLQFCRDELRLNRRTAPQLYIDVQPVTGTLAAPKIGGSGEPIDYLLRMRRFDPAQGLDEVAARSELTEVQIDALAAAIVALHAVAPMAAAGSGYGAPATVQRWVEANLSELRANTHAAADRARLDVLAGWTQQAFARLRPLIDLRASVGAVREVHGDLHLGNVVLISGTPVLFDALEFNPELRWIDVIADIAFTYMDLLDHGQPALAWRLLSAYFEHTGDYGGAALLHFHAVYRALVRAKVAQLRTQQPQQPQAVRVRAHASFEHYLALAEQLAQPTTPRLVVMTGVSGSGKSLVAQALAAQLGALRIRSDVERKRLAGLAAGERGDESIYSAEMTARTYARLQQLTAGLLDAGVSVVVDAASLRADERRGLAQVAQQRGRPVAVVACEAPWAVLQERVSARALVGADASDATPEVLQQQRHWREAAAADEPPHLLIATDCTRDELTRRCLALAARLQAG